MLILGFVFSKFITKELSSSRNIKDRLNRQKVVTTLTRLGETLKDYPNKKGLFIFFGFDEYDIFISKIKEPQIEYTGFYYSCSDSFVIDPILKYFETKYGSIIFISGIECLIYTFQEGQFIKNASINGNLVKRHKKGGQSAQRFDRLAEESRDNYITRVVDRVNNLRSLPNFDKYTCWVFGADEMRNMLISSSKTLVSLQDGGFLTFDNRTINSGTWISYLDRKPDYTSIYDEIHLYLSVNVDMLDFDPANRHNENIRVYLGYDGIPLSQELKHFEYIGLKYYATEE